MLTIPLPPYSTRDKVHLRSAKRLKEMCSQNGGLFIKVGQHVGALRYLLPREYVQTFKVFHSEAPVTPLPRMKQVIEEELGRPGMVCDVIPIQDLQQPSTILAS